MNQQLIQLYRSLLILNSVFFLLYGGWVALAPSYLLGVLQQFSAMDWPEFAFEERGAAFFIVALIRLMGAFLSLLGLTGLLILLFAVSADRRWVWFAIFPIHIIPPALLTLFFYHFSLLGVFEVIILVIFLLSGIAWWRIRPYLWESTHQ